MFWILLSSIAVILFCLILHSIQHFRCTTCYKPAKSFLPRQTSNSRVSRRISVVGTFNDSFGKLTKKAKWHCCLVAIDNEKFDFYPFAFLLYLQLLLLVSALIITKYIYVENNFNETNDNMFIHMFDNINYSYHIFSSYSTSLSFIDWIIIYCIIIISSSESLFNFYRYFTIKFSSKYMHAPSPLKTLQYFGIYVIVFCIIFMIQIHFYYLLFPLVICIYFGYNVYCSYSFGAIFVRQYKQSLPLMENDMIEDVRFMRNTSIFSCFISTICIGMFLIIKDINILYYLPLLWSISCIGYTLNFARNRQFLYETIYNSYTCIRHCQINKIKFNINFKRDSHSLSSTKKQIHEKNMEIIIHSNEEIEEGKHSNKPQQTTVATPIPPTTPETLNITPILTSQNANDIEIDESINHKVSKPSKALLLLGILDLNINIPNDNDNNKNAINNKHHKSSFGNSYSVDFEYDVNTKLPQTPNTGNKSAGNTPMDDNDNDMDPYEALDQIESLQIQMKYSSSEKVLNSDNYYKKQIKFIRKRSTSDPKLRITISPLYEYDNTNNTNNNNNLSINNSFDSKHVASSSHQSEPVSPHSIYSIHSISKVPNKIKQSRSDDLDHHEYVLKLLVGNGFCSRTSWNSIQQLKQFQNAVHNINK